MKLTFLRTRAAKSIGLMMATILVVGQMSNDQSWPRLSQEERSTEYAWKIRHIAMQPESAPEPAPVPAEPEVTPEPEPAPTPAPVRRAPARRPVVAVAPVPEEVEPPVTVTHFRLRDSGVVREVVKERR